MLTHFWLNEDMVGNHPIFFCFRFRGSHRSCALQIHRFEMLMIKFLLSTDRCGSLCAHICGRVAETSRTFCTR
jgi:hypothetical protein